MKKRKRILILLITLIVLAIIGILYYVFTKEDKDSTLNLFEKQWIENNKNQLIDFGLINNIPILNHSTNSLIFSFIESLEENTGLEFNKVSYQYDEIIKEDYAFKVVPKVETNDILVYSDNYVLVGKNKEKFNKLSEIKKGTIGVVSKHLDSINKYMKNDNVKYKSVDTKAYDLLMTYVGGESDMDYIIMPKLLFLASHDSYKDLYINYNITELKDNYVIKLGKTKKLNDIITKYYKKWFSENYEDEYSKGFTSMYYEVSNTDEQSKVKFRSKRYTYGFVENAPFDIEVNGKLYGINSTILNGFSKNTDAEITYKKFSSVKDMKEAFKTNKIDFMFNKYNKEKYDIDIFNTVSMYDEQIVVVTPYDKNIIINSLNSLDNYEVATLSNTKIEETISTKCKKIKTYNNVKELLKYNGIIVIDLATFNFYRNSSFKDYKIDYQFELEDSYSYLVRDIKNNKVFENFLNFYVTYINEKSYINTGYKNALNVSTQDNKIRNIIVCIGGLLCLIVAFLLGSKLRPAKKSEKHKKLIMKKEDKLKYVDMLTSLKNRNYLNDNIERWDESEIYPQSIIIIDLNNIAYINDNYGHQEGDNVIKEAANKLINNQIANSDIIRTNGNEFLIYLVGYDEKQIVAYIKKLKKEFQDLAHGFGAATGYSMITDGIKTIDDAVNEAVLDMRNNKEELNN